MALRRMAARALGNPSGSPQDEDPLEKAAKFSKEMAAETIIENEVAKKKAEREEAEARAAEARARARRADEGGGGGQGFQIKGGVDLGTINLQTEREKAQKELEELKNRADEQAQATGAENASLRDKIHEQEIKMLQLTFQGQMEGLTKVIERMGTQKNFMEQYTEAMETAKALGMNLPSGQGGGLQLQIELKKLDFEQAKALKELSRAEKAEERRWNLELKRLEDEREAKRAELDLQRERNAMWGNMPQMIGAAAARGIMEGRGAPAAQASSNAGKVSSHLEAPWGEAGEFNCPECNEVVGVGPTAKAAACPKCGIKIPIRRTGEKPGAAPKPEAPAAAEGERRE